MRGQWIRKPAGDTSVVFVHGILSRGETCWKHSNGTYWPELLKNEAELEDIGIYVYSYQTGFASGSYSLSNVVDDLKERFFNLDQVADSKKIVFVCHSMGGIVIRKFIVERLNDLLDRQIEIGLYLVASPSLGSDYANWLEPIAKFAGHAQAQALRFNQDNQWLNDLDKTFMNMKESKRLVLYGKELLEDKFITLKSFLRKQVVQPFSGARYFGESFKVAGSDHFSIAKPQDREAVQHRLLKIFIADIQKMIARQLRGQNTLVRESANSQAPVNPPAQRVFISYRHVKPDEDVALALEAALIQDGCQVFVDRRMLVGTEWAIEIDRQLQAAQIFIVLLSTESIRSDMVRQEIKLAHELKKQNRLRILPVRIDFTGALPYDLGGYLNPLQYVLWDRQKTGEVIETLRLAIRDAGELPRAGRSEDEKDSRAQIEALHEITEKRGAPLPQVDPRVLELAMERGAMAADSPFYVQRAADAAIERILQRTGFTATVKAGRQMGKSSLLVRAAAQAKTQGYKVCYIDFQQLDETKLASLQSLLLYMMHRLARDLKTAGKPDDYCNEYLGPKDSITDFVEYAVLAASQTKILLLLDESDRVFNFAYRNDFFALLRFWTNRRAGFEIWRRFNLVIAHATDPALWIDDLNQSPFNVGEAVALDGFNAGQFTALAACYHLTLADIERERLRTLIGGHPYLSRQALYLFANGQYTASELDRAAARQDGPFGDHLRRFSVILSSREPLRRAIGQILRENSCDDEQSFQRLSAAGLVIGASRRQAHLRCRLYEDYFRANL
ncbi:MAG: alpha/beta fold hydrolase [Methylosarcina sp.]